MSKSKGSTDEAIGRPQEWREGRYQEPGKSVDRSVNEIAGSAQPSDFVGTQTAPPSAEHRESRRDPRDRAVTRKDYESLEPPDPATAGPGKDPG